MSARPEVAVIGAGILGLASALALTDRFPGLTVTIVDKEAEAARHQTGRNSGVIHSGLYYRPGSLKARLCVAGAEQLITFCEEHGVPYRRDGKVVVATAERELAALGELERRGTANGLRGLRRLGSQELSEVEPHARGLAALHVPSTGTVDFAQVARAMAGLLADRGVDVRTSFPVEAMARTERGLLLRSGDDTLEAGAIVNCAGLHADRVAALLGVDPPLRIVPFRGEYYHVTGASSGLVRTCIYPVPDPRLPFLGVHLTRTVTDTVHAGPNAVLALAREGYSWGTIEPGELWNTLSYRGFYRLARRHWQAGARELARSMSKKLFHRSLQRLVPAIAKSDLERATSGVRAQAVSRRGDILDDFHIEVSPRAIHVLNAPSPAATASLAIAEHVVDRIALELGLG